MALKRDPHIWRVHVEECATPDIFPVYLDEQIITIPQTLISISQPETFSGTILGEIIMF